MSSTLCPFLFLSLRLPFHPLRYSLPLPSVSVARAIASVVWQCVHSQQPKWSTRVTETLTWASECRCDFGECFSAAEARRSKKAYLNFQLPVEDCDSRHQNTQSKAVIYWMRCASPFAWRCIRIYDSPPFCFQEHGHANELNMLSRNRSFSESLTLFMITPF